MKDILHQASALRAGELLTDSLRQRHPAAWDLLCFHCHLHPVRVPAGLVARHHALLGPQVRAALAALPGPPETRAAQLLDTLFEHSLLLRLHATEDYAVRPEAALLVRDQLPAIEWQAWFERAVVVLERESRAAATPLERLRLLPHAGGLCRRGRKAGVRFPEFAALVQHTAATLHAFGDHSAAEELLNEK